MQTRMMDLPTLLSEPLPFGQACELVVGYLKRAVPLAFWSVSQHEGDRQLYLCVRDDAYGKTAGDSHAWSDSSCRHMVAGVAPQIVPDAMAVAEYAAAGVARALTIGAYIGVPIYGADGALFGTLCALDPHRQQETLLDHAPLLKLCTTLLSQILQAEHLRLLAIDREAGLQGNASHDHVTVLPNRTMFMGALIHAIAQDERADSFLTVMPIHLDDFAVVNDVIGNAAGDELLIMVARRLRTALHPGEWLPGSAITSSRF